MVRTDRGLDILSAHGSSLESLGDSAWCECEGGVCVLMGSGDFTQFAFKHVRTPLWSLWPPTSAPCMHCIVHCIARMTESPPRDKITSATVFFFSSSFLGTCRPSSRFRMRIVGPHPVRHSRAIPPERAGPFRENESSQEKMIKLREENPG